MINNFKKNVTILLIWLILSLIIIAVSSILVYFKIVSVEDKSIYIFVTGVLLFIILGFLSGNIKQAKGLLNGIMLSIFMIIILLLIQFLGLESKMSLSTIAKYGIFILSGGLGGIFGVNFKPIVK
ncbi:TIGR04086 family membrane protein [Mycoplasmatota bacterium]|nr:TIGR04086 family membrane protein [Mycoplasmatota bacterium]